MDDSLALKMTAGALSIAIILAWSAAKAMQKDAKAERLRRKILKANN